MKRTIYWIIINGVCATALYFGMKGDAGAQHVFSFVYWFSAFTVCCYGVIDDEQKAKLRSKGRSVPGWFSHLIGSAFGVACIYSGWWWTVAAIVISEIGEANIYATEDKSL